MYWGSASQAKAVSRLPAELPPLSAIPGNRLSDDTLLVGQVMWLDPYSTPTSQNMSRWRR